MVMPRREVLVQLDDDLVEHLDRIAKALDTNRSELLRRGAQAVIDADNERTNDIELIAAYKRQPPDAVLIRSAARLAAKTAPAW
jgi:metal-responsive CopG/Arc/MetJ family transcriptional regulator